MAYGGLSKSMDAVVDLGRDPASKRQIQSEYVDDQAGAGRDIVEPVSQDHILRLEWGQGNINFPCSADHEQNWQTYTVDPYSC